jgi:hypothetical protein
VPAAQRTLARRAPSPLSSVALARIAGPDGSPRSVHGAASTRGSRARRLVFHANPVDEMPSRPVTATYYGAAAIATDRSDGNLPRCSSARGAARLRQRQRCSLRDLRQRRRAARDASPSSTPGAPRVTALLSLAGQGSHTSPRRRRGRTAPGRWRWDAAAGASSPTDSSDERSDRWWGYSYRVADAARSLLGLSPASAGWTRTCSNASAAAVGPPAA